MSHYDQYKHWASVPNTKSYNKVIRKNITAKNIRIVKGPYYHMHNASIALAKVIILDIEFL